MLKPRIEQGVVTLDLNSLLEYSDVKSALEFLKEKVNDIEGYDLKSFNVEYLEEETEKVAVDQTVAYIKLNKGAHVRVIKTNSTNLNDEIISAAAIYLGEKDGEPRVYATNFQNGEIAYDIDGSYNEEVFGVPNIEKVKAQVAYLDCVWGSSCCTLNGQKYKWCGAGCGSGTPINSLDKCCQYHDNCYGANKSYPARCVCDAILIRCAEGSSVAAADTIIAAFYAKMAAMGCNLNF
jgi:hypothetical protein